jgi:DNA-binding CsgD family transcriptional regulator
MDASGYFDVQAPGRGEAEEPWGVGPALLRQMLDAIDYPVLLTTADGRLLHANHAGRARLHLAHPFLLLEGRVAGSDAAAAAGLIRLLRAGARGDRCLEILQEGRHLVPVAAAPVRGSGLPVPANLVMLTVARGNPCEDITLVGFAKAMGLTVAERRVLQGLIDGQAAPEIARSLLIKVSTARSHIRSILAKTEMSGIRGLLRQVSLLPPIRPVLHQVPDGRQPREDVNIHGFPPEPPVRSPGRRHVRELLLLASRLP